MAELNLFVRTMELSFLNLNCFDHFFHLSNDLIKSNGKNCLVAAFG